MKSTIMILALLTLATGACAQTWSWYGGAMGIYFSDTDFSDENTNLVTTATPFDFYVVLRDAQVNSVAGYECGLEFSDPGVFILAATGPNGWTNFGSLDNYLVGYTSSVLVDANGDAVLGTITGLYAGGNPVELFMGPSDPSSGSPSGNPWGYSWDGPIIADGEDFDHLLCCHLTSGAAGYVDVVATLNADPVATENHSWTQVKNLFE